jgi:hypothetical protein
MTLWVHHGVLAALHLMLHLKLGSPVSLPLVLLHDVASDTAESGNGNLLENFTSAEVFAHIAKLANSHIPEARSIDELRGRRCGGPIMDSERRGVLADAPECFGVHLSHLRFKELSERNKVTGSYDTLQKTSHGVERTLPSEMLRQVDDVVRIIKDKVRSHFYLLSRDFPLSH